MTDDEQDPKIYRVVLNQEEQYSIWPDYKVNPSGWRDAGMTGTKQSCLDYIARVWTDMRPLSLRRELDERGSS